MTCDDAVARSSLTNEHGRALTEYGMPRYSSPCCASSPLDTIGIRVTNGLNSVDSARP